MGGTWLFSGTTKKKRSQKRGRKIKVESRGRLGWGRGGHLRPRMRVEDRRQRGDTVNYRDVKTLVLAGNSVNPHILIKVNFLNNS